MSISRKEFFNYNTKRQQIIEFLKRNSKYAFTPKEVAKRINLKPSTVTATVGKLAKAGILLRRKPYYIYNFGKKKTKKKSKRKLRKKKEILGMVKK